MINETLHSLIVNFDGKKPNYFQIKNSKFVYNGSGYLKCDLFCKFLFDNDQTLVDYDCNANFVLRINFFKTVKIPLSFYMSKFYDTCSNYTLNKRNLLTTLKNIPFDSVLKKSDFTNHQEVFFHEYKIKTYADLKFFKELNSAFDCCVDFNFEKDFEVFLIQQEINLGVETRTLARILDKIRYSSVRFKNEFRNNFKIFHLDYSYDNAQTYEYFCKEFWKITLCNISTIKSTNKVGTFDIEVGLSDNSLSGNLPFPNPISGYVQCIVLHTINLKNIYIENTSKLNVWCFNKFKSNDLASNLIKSFEKYNIYSQDINIKIFNSELDLINSFFVYSLHLDYLIGYNSKSFDLYFLILRAVILNNRDTWFTNKYLSNYDLSSTYGNITFKCEKLVSTSIKCPKCFKKIIIGNNLFESIDGTKTVHCICQNVCTIDPDSIEFNQRTSFYSVQELPYAFHRDLMFQESIFENTSNKKLETACNYHFKQEISHIVSTQNGKASITLSKKFKKSEIFMIANIFIIGIKLVTFTIENNSNQFLNKKFFKLVNVLLLNSEGKIIFDSRYFNFNLETSPIPNCIITVLLEVTFDNVDLNDFLFDSNKYFVSVGKTSNQTLEEQLLLKTDRNLIDTCLYCAIDVLLTFALEYVNKTLFDIQNAEFNLTCPFNVLSWTPARKSSFLLNMQLYKSTILVVLTNFTIADILKQSLEIEGKRCDKFDSHLLYPIFKIKSLHNLNEHLFLDTNTINTNEFDLGIITESDPSNYLESKNISDEIIKNCFK